MDFPYLNKNSHFLVGLECTIIPLLSCPRCWNPDVPDVPARACFLFSLITYSDVPSRAVTFDHVNTSLSFIVIILHEQHESTAERLVLLARRARGGSWVAEGDAVTSQKNVTLPPWPKIVCSWQMEAETLLWSCFCFFFWSVETQREISTPLL